jgi:hypothetical protein
MCRLASQTTVCPKGVGYSLKATSGYLSFEEESGADTVLFNLTTSEVGSGVYIGLIKAWSVSEPARFVC